MHVVKLLVDMRLDLLQWDQLKLLVRAARSTESSPGTGSTGITASNSVYAAGSNAMEQDL